MVLWRDRGIVLDSDDDDDHGQDLELSDLSPQSDTGTPLKLDNTRLQRQGLKEAASGQAHPSEDVTATQAAPAPSRQVSTTGTSLQPAAAAQSRSIFDFPSSQESAPGETTASLQSKPTRSTPSQLLVRNALAISASPTRSSTQFAQDGSSRETISHTPSLLPETSHLSPAHPSRHSSSSSVNATGSPRRSQPSPADYASSSLLSELPTSQSSISLQEAKEPTPLHVIHVDDHVSPAHDSELLRTLQHGRRFRTRNPIQLHPYAFDEQQYHQSLNGTGYRPVRVIDNSFRRNTKSTYVATTGNDNVVSAPRDSSPIPSSPIFAEDSEDFSDLGSSERDALQGEAREGFKRRRLLADEGSSEHAANRHPVENTGYRTNRVRRKFRRKEFRLPEALLPSPSEPNTTHVTDVMPQNSSASGESDSDLPDLLYSRSALATPSVSHRNQTLNINLGSSSDSDIGPVSARRNRRLVRPAAGRIDSQSENSQQDQEALITQALPAVDARDMEKARRRIKGVLPASWLRIDQARKEPVRAASINSPSPSKPERRNQFHERQASVSSPMRTNLPSYSPAVVEINESDSGSSETKNPPAALGEDDLQSLLDSHPSLLFQDEMVNEDIQENDWIDDMRSGASRQTSKPKRKRQPRLTDMLGHRTIRSKRPVDSAPAQRQPARPARNKRFKPPRLSVLDAPRLEDKHNVPDFLKVARRMAKSRPDKGRHSPTSKHMSFHSRDEGLEAEMVLRDWRMAKINPSLEHKSERVRNRQRQILGERPSNLTYKSAQQTTTRTTSSSRPIRSIAPRKFSQNLNARQSRLNYSPLAEEQEYQENQDPNHVPQPQEKRAAVIPKSARMKPLFSRPVNHLRPGMLEELQTRHDSAYPRFAFQRDLQRLGASRGTGNAFVPERDSMLERYLWESEDGPHDSLAQSQDQSIGIAPVNRHDDIRKSSNPPRPKRLRKRPPRQLQVDVYEPHQISDNEEETEGIEVVDNESACRNITESSNSTFPNSSIKAIHGLLPSGMSYSVDFGISPLPVGVCFHQSTFLGSGQFSNACTLAERDFSTHHGFESVQLQETTYLLGPWTQGAASDLQTIFQAIQASLQSATGLNSPLLSTSAASNLLRSVVTWATRKLSLLDAIDLRSCLSLLLSLLEALSEVSVTQQKDKLLKPITPLYWLHLTTFAAQLVQLSHIQPARNDLKDRSQNSFKKCARLSLAILIDSHAADIRAIHDTWRLHSFSDSSIRNADAIESVVGIMLLMQKYSTDPTDFWMMLQRSISENVSQNSGDVQEYERAWHTLFAVLPLCEFDEQGVLQRGKRCDSPSASWTFVNLSLSRLLELYNITPNATAINPYLRVLLSRCYRLIKTWWWQKWDPTLKIVYDFFAQRGFSLLVNEESRGPTRFLEVLDVEQEPKLESNDRSFQIFLKTLAVGFIRLCNSTTEKKIVNIAWRFIPNHGRTHKKEDALRQEDLDALQNQHELLCVLYYATPPTARPRLQLIRGLVDLRLSHLEICRLNIRAWANLTRFQVSSNASTELVHPLLDWLNNAIDQLVQLHAGARVEAESFASHSSLPQASEISAAVTRSNQRQVEVLLSTVLNCLADILKTAKNEAAAGCLYHGVSLSTVFGMYIQGTSHLDALMSEAMKVFQAQASRTLDRDNTNCTGEASGESQDYGDFPSIEDLDDDVPHQQRTESVGEEGPVQVLHNFISNCLGAGLLTNDTFLEQLVDAYVQTSHVQVKNGSQDWADFLEEHGSRAWSSFPTTELSSRFKIYFVARVVQRDHIAFNENSLKVFSTWIVSLAERESMLKYQHLLTNSMLNSWPNHPLLWNLPFTSKPNALVHNLRQYEITLEEFRERRLGLISSVLENMQRQNLAWSGQGKSAQGDSEMRSMCRQLLHIFQETLKRIYEDTVSGSPTRGAYVVFVQQVVSLFQQYTTDIVPVDRYFTDGSTAFPLPADDPTYLVGRLKSYAPKLEDSKTQKQLAAFVLNAFARAAADRQSEYLIDQIKRSVADQFETVGNLTLRRLLVQKIFPAYERAAVETPCGWIVALPVFDILRSIFGSLLSSTDLASQTSMEPTLDMINTTLASFASTFTARSRSVQGNVSIKSDLRMCHLTVAAMRVASAALPVLAYAHRLAPQSNTVASALQAVNELQEYSHQWRENLPTAEGQSLPGRSMQPDLTGQIADPLTQYVAQDLQDTLSREWSCRVMPGEEAERYYVTRGRSKREVVVPALLPDLADVVSSSEDAEGGYAAAIARASKQFDADVEHAFSWRQQRRDDWRRHCNGCADVDI